MRRATFYNSSCLQVALVYFHPFRRNSLLKSKIAKIFKTTYFKGSRSFKVINVNTFKKLVASICYARQHVCAYVQPFFTQDRPIAVK